MYSSICQECCYPADRCICNMPLINIIIPKRKAVEKKTVPRIKKIKRKPEIKTAKGKINSRLEYRTGRILDEYGIYYKPQKKFDDCKNINPLPFDFYLPSQNIVIECQGEQHYRPVEFFGGKKNFLKVKKNDNIKQNYCYRNNIKLIEIPYLASNMAKVREYIDNYILNVPCSKAIQKAV